MKIRKKDAKELAKYFPIVTKTEEDRFYKEIQKQKQKKTPCDWCNREAGVEVHKLNSDRICDKHSNAIIEAIADDWGLWI